MSQMSLLMTASAAEHGGFGGVSDGRRGRTPGSRARQPSDGARGDGFWKALANPWRRQILDELSDGPRTTGDLAESLPDLSRFAVMQHLDVLTNAGIVVIERRGRQRFNHVNAAALRAFYERWVGRYADGAAQEMTALKRHLEEESMGKDQAEQALESVRIIRLENEIRFAATPERVFEALTDPDDIVKWFPYSYGEERTRRIVFEQRVGVAQYEDWGDGRGYLYGHVTQWDPPRSYSVRSRLHPGTVMDTLATIEAVEGGSVLRSSRVIVGPISDEQAAGIKFHGDLARFQEAIRAVVGDEA